MNTTGKTQEERPVSQRIRAFLQEVPDPYHMEAGGLHVELRYKHDAPSLQQKVIQLCHQTREF